MPKPEMSGQEQSVRQRSADYKRALYEPEHGKRVLGDLRVFCGANRSIFSNDALHMARMAGRQEVWLHVEACLKLDEKQRDTMIAAYNSGRLRERTDERF